MKYVYFSILLISQFCMFSFQSTPVSAQNITPDQAFAALPFGVIDARNVQGGRRAFTPMYSYYIGPHAVVTSQTVFTAFQNTRGRPVVMAYDKASKSWQGPVIASIQGLGGDAHGNPALYIDRQGYLHLFYGCHTKAMLHTMSAEPRDITRWNEQSSPTPKATYPQVFSLSDGKAYLFYRAGGHMEPWTMLVSSDDCTTWSDPAPVIEMRRDPPDPLAAAYSHFFPSPDGKTIHCFWVHKDDNPGRINSGRMDKHPWRFLKYPGLHEAVYRYNLYYIYRDTGGVWRNAAGKAISLPVSKTAADRDCLVIDSGDEFCNFDSPVVDAEHRPYVRYTVSVGDWTTGLDEQQVEIKKPESGIAYWDGTMWRRVKDIQPGWPADAVSVLAARGVTSFGDHSSGRWFIGASRAQNNPDIGYYITLTDPQGRYIPRSGGPALIPVE